MAALTAPSAPGVLMEKLAVPDGAPTLPPATLRCLKEAFLVFDSDGSGSITSTELGAVLKHLGRDATEVELADMLSELYKAAGGSIDALSFAAFYAVVAPKLLVEAERNWRRTAAADADAEAFRSLGGDPTAAGTAGGIAVERLVEQLCALTGIARASAEDIFNESAVDGKVSFEAFQRVMAAAVEGG